MTTGMLLRAGDFVALALREPVGGSSCYVGTVQEVGERGVRITCVDWLTGSSTGWDIFAAWDNILGAQVGTAAHKEALRDQGLDEFGAFQTRHKAKP